VSVGSYEPAGGPRPPTSKAASFRRLCPESVARFSRLGLEGSRRSPAQKRYHPRGAQRPDASSIRGQPVVAARRHRLRRLRSPPKGIGEHGYRPRIRAMEEEMRMAKRLIGRSGVRSKTYAGAFLGLPSYSTVTDLAKFRG
jgi:hypothetical protein